ncbi:MAG: class II glutamine amidotransferase, partial [Acidimicrobiia bacterium]|nr:class II glutamine amidotransferase [Acidimicrobiia bacterium]
MCRLYGFRATQPTRVECTLVHAQNALMVQSRTDATGRSHAHGWGIAVYENHLPSVSREAWDAYQNEAFRDAAARVYSETVLAHVRRATVGAASIENTHPFVHEEWSFAHNGTIPNFDS